MTTQGGRERINWLMFGAKAFEVEHLMISSRAILRLGLSWEF